MRVSVTGAAGRMGRTIIQEILATEDCDLVGAIEHEGSPHLGQDAGSLAGADTLGVEVTSDALAVIARSDAVIDFTTPDAAIGFAMLTAQSRAVHVIGTTGMTDEQLAKLGPAARHACIIRSGNMSLGVNLLAGLVRQAARALDPDFDIEIVEMHHNRKVDAPSGTAYLFGEAAAEGRDISLADHSVRVRDGQIGSRGRGDIGFATLRGGTVVGEHTVIFAGPHERIELTHRAEDRGIFARGAVKAALWGRGKKPGLYSMADVLGLSD
ncbi:MAG: 4-hydroxy-tetrahydrodipicolinate reductase [Pseudomonadota bacterium]